MNQSVRLISLNDQRRLSRLNEMLQDGWMIITDVHRSSVHLPPNDHPIWFLCDPAFANDVPRQFLLVMFKAPTSSLSLLSQAG